MLHDLRNKESLFVAEEFTEARSAMVPDKRPVFREMLDRIIRGEANAILCWHTNRLYRNTKEYGEVHYLLQTGVIQCIKTPEREYHPEDHGLLMAVEASMATQYSRDLKRDVTRGVEEKADRGWYPFKPKSGYVLDPFTKELLPDPKAFPLLRQAVDLMLTDHYTVEAARCELNSWGYLTPRTISGGAKPMSRSGMYRFLSDRFYVGEYQFKGIWMQSRHMPLLSREEFEKIQRYLGRRLKTKPQRRKFAYTGLMRCGFCGCQITAETHVKRYKTTGHSKTYTYYHCTGSRGCSKRSIPEEQIDGQIRDLVDRARLAPDFIEWAIRELQRDERDQRKTSGEIRPQQASVLRAVSLKLDSLWDMRHGGEISADEFRVRKAKYDEEVKALRDQSYRMGSLATRSRQEAIKALTFSRDAYDKFIRGGVDERRQVAVDLSRNYVLTLETLEIRPHPVVAKFLTFEPKSRPSQQSEMGGTSVDDPGWRRMLDDILTVISGSENVA